VRSSQLKGLADRVLEPNRDVPDDDEALFAELEAEMENDEDPIVRESGLVALRKEFETMKEMREKSYGTYTEITDEKEVMRVSAHEPRCVVHFYHTNFKRCEIMDKHLAILAVKYFRTRFVRAFVENVPWLVQRLAVKVLPCVMCFTDGVSKDRLVGFEELGNTDTFATSVLEERLLSSGVISPSPTVNQIIYDVTSPRKSALSTQDEDEIFDL